MCFNCKSLGSLNQTVEGKTVPGIFSKTARTFLIHFSWNWKRKKWGPPCSFLLDEQNCLLPSLVFVLHVQTMKKQSRCVSSGTDIWQEIVPKAFLQGRKLVLFLRVSGPREAETHFFFCINNVKPLLTKSFTFTISHGQKTLSTAPSYVHCARNAGKRDGASYSTSKSPKEEDQIPVCCSNQAQVNIPVNVFLPNLLKKKKMQWF